MRRFYFRLRAGDELVPDEEGIDLPDLSAARREAIEAARELLAEAIKDGRAEVPEAFEYSGTACGIHAIKSSQYRTSRFRPGRAACAAVTR